MIYVILKIVVGLLALAWIFVLFLCWGMHKWNEREPTGKDEGKD
jgi:hypothetical protein